MESMSYARVYQWLTNGGRLGEAEVALCGAPGQREAPTGGRLERPLIQRPLRILQQNLTVTVFEQT